VIFPAPRDYGVESAKIAASVKTTPLAIRITEPAVAHAVGSVLAAKRNATKATTAKTAASNVDVCTVIATTCLVNVVAVQVGRDHYVTIRVPWENTAANANRSADVKTAALAIPKRENASASQVGRVRYAPIAVRSGSGAKSARNRVGVTMVPRAIT
jgi:hypothetical protein